VSVSANRIQAISPAAVTAGTVDVTVTTASSTSAASPADRFTYGTAPTVTGISPATGLPGGGTGVVISGTNLLGATLVDFGANPATIFSTSPTQIVVIDPAGAAGMVDVTVTTPLGTSATSPVDQFTYVATATPIYVTTTSDALVHDGISLRDAIAQANLDASHGSSDTIRFNSSLNGDTFTLAQGAQGQLVLSGQRTGIITIDGGGHVTLDGAGTSSVFQIDGGAHAVLTGLTIRDGNAGSGDGGAIDNAGTLTLLNDNLSNNTATNGGAIDNTGMLTLTNSTLSNNSASAGGAIDNVSGGHMTVTGSTLTDNIGSYLGGAIDNQATMSVTNSTLAGNNSYLGGGINNGNQYGNGGTLTLTGDNLSGNTVTGNGGGICMENGGYDPKPSTLTLRNTIVAGNTADQMGPDVYVSSGSISGAYVTENPTNQSVNAGQKMTFTASAGNANANVQWQLSSNGGASWSTIAGATGKTFATVNGVPTTTTTLTMATTAAMNGYWYRVAFITSAGPTYSLPAQLTVNFLTIAKNPVSLTVSAGNAATFTAAANANPSATVAWQSSSDGGKTWSPLSDGGAYSGTSTNTLTITGATSGLNGREYRAAFGNPAGLAATTTAATLTVDFLTLTASPVRQTLDAGQKVTFTAVVSANPAVQVQWQVSSKGGAWSNVIGVTNLTLSFAVSTGLNGNQYRAFIKNLAGSLYTNPATLSVNPALAVGNVSKTQWTLGLPGFSGTLTISGGTGPFTIKTASGLPAGLVPSLIGNIIGFTGSPTKAGTFNGSITIVDGTGASLTRTVAITIKPSIKLPLANLPFYSLNVPYAQTISASGGTGPVSLSYVLDGPLPAGLTITPASPTTGAISIRGTPKTTGKVTINVTATDSLGATTTATYVLTS